MDIRLLILLFLVALSFRRTSAEKLKLCVVKGERTAKKINALCQQLVTLGSQVECVIGNDRFNCLRQLAMSSADFTVLEPEDLIATAAYKEYNILVTNELRLFPDEKQRFEMVVIVHKDVKNIWDIKGKRFCHSGFDATSEWTEAFSTYFEKWIIPKECDPNKTLLENRLTGLSNFFEAACIAGPWSGDTLIDNRLKSKYRNLCAACDNPVGCYLNDKYHGREGALLCLTDNVGDIAWVRLDDTLEHFKDEQINKDDYNYLCPDGTTRPVKFGKPCVWIAKPWPVIVAKSELAEKVRKLMSSVKTEELGRLLRELLENYNPTPVSTDILERPEDFLIRFVGFMSANNRATCRPSRRVLWCIASNIEDRKCRWLREASLVYRIDPAISCIHEKSRAVCLKEIQTGRVDIFVAKPEELLSARKMGLKSMAQAIPKKSQDFNRIAAVVKQSSRFHSLKELKGAKASFTGYKDVGWNAFLSALRNISGVEVACSDMDAVSNFFSESCVSGLSDKNEDVPRNLYSLCKQPNKSGDDATTFHYLATGLVDVAFVNLKNIEPKIGSIRNVHSDQTKNEGYRTLCVHEMDADDEKACLLTWAPLNSIVAHENITNVRREEIYTMLLKMDEFFGYTFIGETPAFAMYGPYDTNSSIIFSEETAHLQMQAHQLQQVQSYNDVVNHIAKQATCGGTTNWNLYYSNMLFTYALVIVFTKLQCA